MAIVFTIRFGHAGLALDDISLTQLAVCTPRWVTMRTPSQNDDGIESFTLAKRCRLSPARNRAALHPTAEATEKGRFVVGDVLMDADAFDAEWIFAQLMPTGGCR